ncbi:uncharacterized protein LOC143452304 [Clavelina lepadiformis]|uniref:uncharacterized protein LOC143452304 n=1 Tax=Clavelina lepadiformis TaxID=159417 RepID=UPI0040429E3A
MKKCIYNIVRSTLTRTIVFQHLLDSTNTESVEKSKTFVDEGIVEVKQSGTPYEYMPLQGIVAIGKDGGHVQIDKTEINIPPGAVDDYIAFVFTLFYTADAKDNESLAISPTLECKPFYAFSKAVKISLPTCYLPYDSVTATPVVETEGSKVSLNPVTWKHQNTIQCEITSVLRLQFKTERSSIKAKQILFKYFKSSNCREVIWEILDGFQDEQTNEQQQFIASMCRNQDLVLQMMNKGGAIVASKLLETKHVFFHRNIALRYSYSLQEEDDFDDTFTYSVIDRTTSEILHSDIFTFSSLQFSEQDGNHDGGNHDGGNHDGGNQDGGNDEGGNHDGGNHDGGNHDGGNHDGGNHDGGNHEGGKHEGGKHERGKHDGDNHEGGKHDDGGDDRMGGKHDIVKEGYEMISKHRNTVLVISNYEFPERTGLTPLPCHEEDQASIEILFKNYLFCNVLVLKNKKKQEMWDYLKEFSQDILHHDFCAVFILSHGAQTPKKDEVIVGTDNGTIHVSEVIKLFTRGYNKTLENKPKLLFLDCCRNKPKGVLHARMRFIFSKITSPSKVDEEYSQMSAGIDLLVAYATKPGQVSYETTREISFAALILDVFQKHADREHLLDMLIKVNARLTKERNSNVQQLADYRPFLLNKLYFDYNPDRGEHSDSGYSEQCPICLKTTEFEQKCKS